jgi:hypothetical protein
VELPGQTDRSGTGLASRQARPALGYVLIGSVLATDASDIAILAVLQQEVNGGLAPISYYSRVLTPSEQKYSTYEKECLAVLFGWEKCRVFLEHKEFELHCDNLP